jgi:hypothetical protein
MRNLIIVAGLFMSLCAGAAGQRQSGETRIHISVLVPTVCDLRQDDRKLKVFCNDPHGSYILSGRNLEFSRESGCVESVPQIVLTGTSSWQEIYLCRAGESPEIYFDFY